MYTAGLCTLSAVILYNELNSKDYNCVDYDRAIWVDLLVLFKLKKSAILGDSGPENLKKSKQKKS